MPNLFADRVKDTSTTTGTGAFTLANSAPTGFQTFNTAFGTSNPFYYVIDGGAEWEVGIGQLSSSTSLTRTTILASSNSNNAVNFSAGSKTVFCDVPAYYIFRRPPRTGTATSSATPTINTDNVDFYHLTAQAADITSFTTNLSGTPVENQKLWIAITGTASRAITWGASFEASNVPLPTTTVGTDRLDAFFVWNTVTSKWRIVGASATATDLEAIIIPVSDETTNLTTGTAKITFRMPYAFTLSAVRANVNTAPTGSTIIVDINEEGSTIMTTNKLSIDASEKTSQTAATAAGLTDTALADDAEITIDIDQVGSTIAGKGLKVVLIGRRAA